MVKERVCLGCNCIAECLDQEAKAVLWINDYYKRKAKKLQLYPENVSQYVMPGFWQTQEGFCRAKEYSEGLWNCYFQSRQTNGYDAS